MIGDLHGSAHTFIRHLFRYHRMGILDLKTLKFAPGYRLVFLGDVIDRGLFSLEITALIIELVRVNNLDFANPIVIYNRGNHEELSTSSAYGFKTEIMTRCGGEGLFQSMNEYYTCLSSAVIIETQISNQTYRLWLCHGGFDSQCVQPNNPIANQIKDASVHIIPFDFGWEQRNIRWSDFEELVANDDLVVNYKRGGVGFIYNRYHVYQFLKNCGINFIVRGHQDSFNNNYLFAGDYTVPESDQIPVENLPGFGLNYSVGRSAAIVGEHGEVVIYNHNDSKSRQNHVHGPIARLVADCNEYFVAQTNGLDYYYASAHPLKMSPYSETELIMFPVLTISTNTDADRYLMADSFAVLRFDVAPYHQKVDDSLLKLNLQSLKNLH
jgi:hypothetical protein